MEAVHDIDSLCLLPADLAQLERRFPEESGVVVVGVHSAKFTNEKQSGSVANAIARYGIRHAVVNDPGADLWGRLGVTCWPTLVVVAPGNTLLHYIIGEGHGEELMFFMEAAVDHYRGLIKPPSLTPVVGGALYYEFVFFPDINDWTVMCSACMKSGSDHIAMKRTVCL